ncbi:MAG: BREX-1 system phosphatase PglZ type A [Cyanobacteria bacterium J06627_28]
MNRDRIQASLQAIFQDDSRWHPKTRRIVFWYDSDGQFQTTFEELALPNVTKLQLGDTPFTTKYRLLIQAPEQAFLLYAPYAEPAPADNWLLDIQKSAQSFSADRAALIFADLSLHQRSLEGVIRQHLTFFNSSQRSQALQDMPRSPNIQQPDLLLAMLCVLANLKVADASSLIRQVLMGGLLESDNSLWADIDRFVSADAFWQVVADHLSISDSKPSLKKLLTRLLVTHLATTLHNALPPALDTYAIRPGQQAYAFIDRWMRDQIDADSLKPFTEEIGTELKIFNLLESLAADTLREAAIFESVDQVLARQCIQVIAAESTDFSYWQDLIQSRRTLFWFPKYRDIYQALEAALTLFELRQRYEIGFRQPAAQLFKAYATDLHKFDRAYRDYIVASDAAQGDVLKGLTVDVENLYVNWFLEKLGYDWSESLGSEWTLADTPQQNQFFRKQVVPILNRNEREKVFVIISDAMRYEVAAELKEVIEKELRGKTEIAPQLCLLPSVTKLGMATLLPGRQWQLLPGKSDVKVDGLSSQGLDAREAVLNQNSDVSATVIRAADLKAMKTDQGREVVKPHRLIYIYHDVIDAVGDKAASERHVMEACKDAIAEVLRLVKRICNSLNGTHVIITADHGFLYQRKPIAAADKMPLPSGDDILETNRRYVLGTRTAPDPETLSFPLAHVQDTGPDPVNIVVPRGSVRFAKQGAGAQYVHGGASLQEVCVPVIRYHHKRAHGDDGPARKVGVQVNARARRVTNNRFRLSLIQTDPVAGRWRSRPITVALYHAETDEPLTDVKRVELNSTGERPSDREFTQTLTVLDTNPPSSANLIVKDADDDIELLRESWTVSIGIINDFGDF